MKRLDLKKLPDDPLLALFIAGEVLAGDVLLARHRAGIYSFFSRRVTPDDAEDLTQRVLAVLMEVPERDAPITSSFRAFAFGVARMTLHNFCSRKAKGRRFDPDVHTLASLDPSLSSRVSRHKRMHWLSAAIELLPVEAQTLLDLRYGQGLTYPEIAAIYGQPEPTLRRRMQAIKAKLQTMRQRYTSLAG